MLRFVQEWYEHYFSDREALMLVLMLVIGFALIITMGKVLAPALTAIVLAYLLQGLINQLIARSVPQMVAIWSVYLLFLTLLTAFLFFVIPLTWSQLIRLLNDQLPRLLVETGNLLQVLPERYPEYVTQEQISELVKMFGGSLKVMVESVVSFSLANLPNLVGILIFLVLVPILVFFFLKDKDLMIGWVVSYLPAERPFFNRIIGEMNDQISNYVRGKAIEIIVVGLVTYVGLKIFGVNYAALLSFLVGLSVLVPYIGAAVVTIPVALVAYFQFGWESQFFWVMAVYGIIQALDGNLLVPLLFSEAVNLHPVAIILAVLVFGGIWGMWGVFFAIPLATLVKALMVSWPRLELPPNQLDWLDPPV
jgi:putative permease